MRNSYPDGEWTFNEVALHIHGGYAGMFSGAVTTEDGEIGAIFLDVTYPQDREPVLCEIAKGSFLHAALLPQLTRDLAAMIEWQSGGRKNLTATSRATRALVTP